MANFDVKIEILFKGETDRNTNEKGKMTKNIDLRWVQHGYPIPGIEMNTERNSSVLYH